MILWVLYTRSALCIIIFFDATVDTLSLYLRSISYTLLDYIFPYVRSFQIPI
jgi:hypothetical protein